MAERISFVCPTCNSKLRAADTLVGRSGPCPRCGEPVVVPPCPPDEQGPILVMDDSDVGIGAIA
jgi:DNA-directed RNA polymerase subunit RPC12/RpoP